MYGGKQCDRIQKINQKHSNNQNRTASYVCVSNNPSHPGFQLLIVNLDSQFHQGRAHFYIFFLAKPGEIRLKIGRNKSQHLNAYHTIIYLHFL